MEKVLALGETILAFWLAYPASVAFGKVLLQTAPPQDTVQMLALKKAIREVREVCRRLELCLITSTFIGRGASFCHASLAAKYLAINSS
jgi:hypothetical protein